MGSVEEGKRLVMNLAHVKMVKFSGSDFGGVIELVDHAENGEMIPDVLERDREG